jgi:hypothetical protein
LFALSQYKVEQEVLYDNKVEDFHVSGWNLLSNYKTILVHEYGVIIWMRDSIKDIIKNRLKNK